MSEAIEQPQVVFGASGGVGSALVRELLSRGRRVRAVSHSGRGSFPKEAEVVRADATDTATVREVSRGAVVVYHTVNAPYLQWQEKLPLVMSAIIEVAADAGAKLIYADNLYMYGMVDGPMTEETPYEPVSRKGILRAQLADEPIASHRNGKVRVSIGRASDVYGPGPLNAVAGERLFGAALAGKKAMWVGSLDAPHTLTYIARIIHKRFRKLTKERAMNVGPDVPRPDANAPS